VAMTGKPDTRTAEQIRHDWYRTNC